MSNTTQVKIQKALEQAKRLGAEVDEQTLTHYVEHVLVESTLTQLAGMLIAKTTQVTVDAFNMDAQVQMDAITRELTSRDEK